MADRIQIKRGTAAQATSANEVLGDGEFGLEKDTKKIKVGDGITAWNDLPYIWEPQDSSPEGVALRKYADAWYNNGYASNIAEPTIASDEVVFVPIMASIYMNANTTLKAIRINQVAGGNNVELRFGLYELLSSGSLSLTSDLGFILMTGLSYGELTTNVTLVKGKFYYIAVKFNNNPGTTTQVRGVTGDTLGPFGVANADMIVQNQGLRKPATNGTFPSTDTLPTVSTIANLKGNIHLNYKLQTI